MKIKKLNTILLFITLLFTSMSLINGMQAVELGDFTPDNNGHCYLTSTKEFTQILKSTVDTFKDHLEKESGTEHDAYNLILFEDKLANFEALYNEKNASVNDVQNLINSTKDFTDKYYQLKYVSLLLQADTHEKVKEALKKTRNVYIAVAEAIRKNDERPYYFTNDLSRVVKYHGLSILWAKRANQDACMSRKSIDYFDEIHEDLNTETVITYPTNNNTFQVKQCEINYGAIHYGFWMNLSIPDINNGNKNVFSFQANENKISLDLEVGTDGASINQVFTVGDKKYTIVNNSACPDLAFVTIHIKKEFDSYNVRLVIKSTHENNRKAVSINVPAKYIEFGTFNFPSNVIVSEKNIYKLVLSRPDYCASEQHMIALQELQLITQLDYKDIASLQDYLETQCVAKPPQCTYYYNNTCHLCDNSYFNVNGECKPTCPVGTYPNYKYRICIPCDKSCKSCISQDTCTSCPESYNLWMNKCIANCPSNTWPINGYCVYCNDDCEVCKSAKECAKCKTHYLFDNKCIENCPNGYYHATNPNRCEKCYDNCVVCNDNNRCQVCKEGYYLLAGFCIKDCPNGFFKNEYNKTCDKCKLECETCNSANICVECADGYSLLGTTCITDCPDSYVSINGVCTPCGNNCKNCLSSDVTICTNCLPGYVLKNGKCVVNCGDGYFANSLNICAPCGNNCMSCSNQDSCNLCYKPYFNYRGICISYCPDSFVGVGNECVMCDPESNCKHCCKSDQSKCKECFEGDYLYNKKCIDKCPEKTYIDGRTCKDCLSSCKSCVNGLTCVECINGLNLKDGVCVFDCGSGYTAVNGRCVPCTQSNCKVCNTSIDECNLCEGEYALMNTFCLQFCLPGTYKLEGKCVNCINNCMVCDNGFTCKECNKDYILSPSKTQCILTCPTGYVNINGKCLPCTNKNCLDCANDRTTCITCPPGTYLHDKNCGSCPHGYVADKETQKCVPCKAPCSHCVNTPETCVSCIENYSLIANENTCTDSCPIRTASVNGVCTPCKCEDCLYCGVNLHTCYLCDEDSYLLDGKCHKKCPLGYYENKDKRICSKCSDNCLTCHCEETCYSCEAGYKLHNKVCIKDCPKKSVVQTTAQGQICVPCGEACNKCTSNNPNICIVCEENYFLHNGTCEKNCPLGYYGDVESKICIKCTVNNCNYCHKDKCILCSSGLVLFNNKCIDSCPLGYRTNGRTCEKCKVENCLECNASANTCEKCLPNYFQLDDKTCSDKCPEYTYPVIGTQNCHPCNTLCATCIDHNRCIVCRDGFFLRDDGVCVETCEVGSVGNPKTKRCEPCDTNCLVCSFGDNKRCNLCKQGFFLFENICVKECPEKYYKCTNDRLCKPCHSSCEKCSVFYKCDTCPPGMVLHNNYCVDSCPDGYVKVGNKCEQCKTSDLCIKCSPLNLEECINCGDNILFDGRCIINCPNGYIKLNKTCVPCPSNCLVCSTPNECTICKGNFKVFNGICIEECFNGYVDVNGRCEPCTDLNCSKCGVDKVCKKCNEGYFIKYTSEGVKCVEDCGYGYYVNNGICLPCNDSNCLTCLSNNNCYYCKEGYVLLDNAQCILDCPSGYVNINNKCVKCNDNCKECCKSNIDKCKACRDNEVLFNGKCYSQCPDGYVELADDLGKCAPCGVHCLSCYSSNAEICSVCKPGYVLFVDGTCRTDCGPNYTEENGVCIPCQVKDCVDCKGNFLACVTCTPPYVLVNDVFCVRECIEGTYQSGNVCLPCNNCPTCEKDTGLCTSCADGFFLTSYGTCNTQCVDGQVKIGDECVNCKDSNCKECLYPEICNQCKSGYLLFNGMCVEKCPSGTYLSGTVCKICDSSCSTCLTENFCLTCREGYFLKNQRCVKECGEGYTIRDGRCEPCKETCKYCSTDTNTCYICKEGFYLFNGKCVKDCGPGYYVSTTQTGEICAPCSEKCVMCLNSNNCNYCYDNYKILDGKCVQECPNGYVEKEGTCYRCTSGACDTCLPNNLDVCVICVNGYYLKQGKCVSNCGLGYYVNDSNECTPCEDKNCLTCCANSKKCKDCKDGFYLFFGMCVSKCPSGYIANSSDECIKCTSSDCNTCLLNNLDMCIDCSKGYLLNGQCYDICPLGFYGKDKLCLPCSKNCLECFTFGKCNRCDEPFKLHDGECKIDCPLGYAVINGQCVPCNDNNCLYCSADISTCNICKAPYVLFNGYCIKECPPTYYSTGSECKKCEDNCEKCNNSTECVKCRDNYLLYQYNCVEICPPFTYPTAEGECKFCTDYEKCKICSSLNPENCLACSSGILYNGKCIEYCPSKTYYDNESKTCKPCQSNCVVCSNADMCSICSSGYVLFNNICLPKCPSGYVQKGMNCIKCGPGCLTCCENNVEKCITCNENLFLHNKKCIASCPKGTYYSTDSNGQLICSDCDNRCTSCLSLDRCTECISGFFLDGQTCVDKCPNNRAEINGVCHDCTDKNCDKCCATNLNICKVCKPGYLLWNNTCVLTCPSGFYADTIETKCKKCDENCTTCKNAYECTKCAPGLFFMQGTFNCVKCSPPLVVVENECRVCKAEQCDKCVSGTDNICEKCSGNWVNIEGVCKEDCPVGYYRSNGGCLPCGNDCLVCQSNEKCVYCKIDFFLLNGDCVPKCPVGYGVDQSRKCVKCEVENCLECNGDKSKECKACLPNYVLHDNKCVQDCPLKYFHNTQTDTCQSCPSLCYICSNKDSCIICEEQYYNYNGKCVERCPDGYYNIEKTKICVPCEIDNCKQCSSTKCEDCLNGYFLMGSAANNDLKCVVTCPEGYYRDLSGPSPKCLPCGSACKECINSETCYVCENEGLVLHNGKCISSCPLGYTRVGNNCVSCKDSNCLVCAPGSVDYCVYCSNGYLLDGDCKNKCPVGYYANEEERRCKKCDEKCITCTSKDKCTLCKNEFNLLDGKCLNECPKGTYSFNGKCESCLIDNCDACHVNSKGNKECSQCSEGFYLLGSICYKECPKGYFSNENGVCEYCPYGCLSCKNEESCEVCREEWFMYNGKCLQYCPEGTFADCQTKTCEDCLPECETCYSNKPNSCFRCANGYVKLPNGVCGTTTNCGSYTFYNQSTNSCQPCDILNCVSCVNQSQCHICENDYMLVSGKCVKEVKDQHYYMITDNTILQTPFSSNYNQKTVYKLNETSLSNDSNTLSILFHLRDLKINHNLNNRISSFVIRYENKHFSVEFGTNNEGKCILLVLNKDNKSITEFNNDRCARQDMFDWRIFKITIHVENQKASFKFGDIYHKDSNQSSIIDVSEDVKAIDESSTISLLNDDMDSTSGTQIAKVFVADYNISNISMAYNQKPLNDLWPSGVIVLDNGLADSGKEYKLIEKLNDLSVQGAEYVFGFDFYVYLDYIPSGEFTLGSLYYPYTGIIKNTDALTVKASDKVAFEAKENSITISSNLLSANKWILIKARITTKLNEATYNIVVLDSHMNLILNEKADVENDKLNTTKLFADASAVFGLKDNGKVYNPYIVLGYHNTNNKSINEIVNIENCEFYDKDLKCAICKTDYKLTSNGLCMDNVKDYSNLVSNTILSFDDNQKSFNVSGQNIFTYSFLLRKTVHSVANNVNKENVLLSFTINNEKVPFITQELKNKYQSILYVRDQHFEADFGNVYFDFFNVVVVKSSDMLSVYLSDPSGDRYVHSTVQYPNSNITEMTIFDSSSSEIQFEALNLTHYSKVLSNQSINRILNQKPQELNPLCIEGDYITGECKKCYSVSKVPGKCSTGIYGLTYLQVYDNSEYEGKTYELDSKLDHSVNSNFYSVTTKFIVYELEKDGEYNVLYLRNNAHKDNKNTPSDKLIQLAISKNSDSANLMVSYNDFDKITKQMLDIPFEYNKWYYFVATMDVKEKKLHVAIGDDDNTLNKEFELSNYTENLQNVAQLVLLGENASDNNLVGELVHTYIVPNPPKELSKLVNLYKENHNYKPNEPETLDHCQIASYSESRKETICVKCENEYIRKDGKCV